MPTLPWTSLGEIDPTWEYIVLASRLPLAGRRRLPQFLRATSVIRRQLAHSDGLVGYGLDAGLISNTYLTLSVWRDSAALDAFAHGHPHQQRVEQIRPHMNPSTFVTWTVRGDALPVTWADARRRIDAAR